MKISTKDELRELIKFLALRAKTWRQVSIYHRKQENIPWASFNYEKYIESRTILKHVISIYLPVKHDGVSASRWRALKRFLENNLVEFGQFKECHTGELERTYGAVLSKMRELEEK